MMQLEVKGVSKYHICYAPNSQPHVSHGKHLNWHNDQFGRIAAL